MDAADDRIVIQYYVGQEFHRSQPRRCETPLRVGPVGSKEWVRRARPLGIKTYIGEQIELLDPQLPKFVCVCTFSFDARFIFLLRTTARFRFVKLIGLGGGIGSGKSTVSLLLAELGAVIVDADVIARKVVEPGQPALAAIVKRFGDSVLLPDGTMNRPAVASIVFHDKEALADLNAITHPAIGEEIAKQIAMHRGTDRVVVLDAALLFDRARLGMVGRTVVDVEPDVAVARLMEFRGFSETDARARVASQMSREERRSLADRVIDNSGDRSALHRAVESAWAWIQTLPESTFE
jgi:dephospho-CoA kinase